MSTFRSQKDLPLSIKHGEQGATAIEYGVIASLIALAALLATMGLGNAPANTLASDSEVTASR